VIDIMPTILDATGIKAPELINGIPQKPIEGVNTLLSKLAENWSPTSPE
jgi:arylsulfatase A-like enzyme